MPATVQRDDALLLRSVDYGDADRVLTLLTRQHGKLGVLAKSARKSKRRFAGALEPFALLRIEFAPARAGLARLESATIERAFPNLLGDLARMNVAGAGLSLLRELLPEALPDAPVFEDAVQLLAALDARALPERGLGLGFALQQLSRAGYRPGLEACGVCGRVPAPGRASDFDARRGFVVCQACGGAAFRLRASTRSAWQAACEGDVAAAALGGEPGGWTAEELELSGRALEAFIAHHLERAPAARR